MAGSWVFSESRVTVFYSLGVVESPILFYFFFGDPYDYPPQIILSLLMRKKTPSLFLCIEREPGIILMTKINSSAFGPWWLLLRFTEPFRGHLFLCVSQNLSGSDITCSRSSRAPLVKQARETV